MTAGGCPCSSSKTLSTAAIPAALAQAERYRLLNEPAEAESICLDVLRIDPDHQEALVTLVLALTDQFPDGGARARGGGRREGASRGSATTTSGYYISGSSASGAARRCCAAIVRAPAVRRRSGCAKRWPATSGPRRSGRRTTTKRVLRWNTCARILMSMPAAGAGRPGVQRDPVRVTSQEIFVIDERANRRGVRSRLTAAVSAHRCAAGSAETAGGAASSTAGASTAGSSSRQAEAGRVRTARSRRLAGPDGRGARAAALRQQRPRGPRPRRRLRAADPGRRRRPTSATPKSPRGSSTSRRSRYRSSVGDLDIPAYLFQPLKKRGATRARGAGLGPRRRPRRLGRSRCGRSSARRSSAATW